MDIFLKICMRISLILPVKEKCFNYQNIHVLLKTVTEQSWHRHIAFFESADEKKNEVVLSLRTILNSAKNIIILKEQIPFVQYY